MNCNCDLSWSCSSIPNLRLLTSKPSTPSDLRESFSSIYRYDNVVNVN